MKKENYDFMIFESYYEGIRALIASGHRKEAGALALEILRYGSHGERTKIFENRILESMMRGFIPLIDKSKENFRKAVEASERRAQMRKQHSSDVNDDADKKP